MLVNGQIQSSGQLYAPILEAEIAEWEKGQSIQPTKDCTSDITKARLECSMAKERTQWMHFQMEEGKGHSITHTPHM